MVSIPKTCFVMERLWLREATYSLIVLGPLWSSGTTALYALVFLLCELKKWANKRLLQHQVAFRGGRAVIWIRCSGIEMHSKYAGYCCLMTKLKRRWFSALQLNNKTLKYIFLNEQETNAHTFKLVRRWAGALWTNCSHATQALNPLNAIHRRCFSFRIRH